MNIVRVWSSAALPCLIPPFLDPMSSISFAPVSPLNVIHTIRYAVLSIASNVAFGMSFGRRVDERNADLPQFRSIPTSMSSKRHVAVPVRCLKYFQPRRRISFLGCRVTDSVSDLQLAIDAISKRRYSIQSDADAGGSLPDASNSLSPFFCPFFHNGRSCCGVPSHSHCDDLCHPRITVSPRATVNSTVLH